MARRAHIPRLDGQLGTLPAPYTRGDVQAPDRPPAGFPEPLKPEDVVLGQLSTIGDELARMRQALERAEAAGESDPKTVPSDTDPTTLVDARSNRQGLTIWNDATTSMRVKFGAGVSTNSFSFKLAPGEFYELPKPVYRGIVTAVWEGTPTGSAMVTELV